MQTAVSHIEPGHRPQPQPASEPESPAEQQQRQQQQEHHQQQQQNHLHHHSHQPQFQEQAALAQARAQAAQAQAQAHAQASSQGHASPDRSLQMLREAMDTPTSHYSSAEVMHHTSTSSPSEPHNSEHMSLQDSSLGDHSPDGRKGYGKRELSTSKRAAQNRAAQRAFRQRKEGYIKKLEEQVREYSVLSENFKAVQQENYQLRDYIIALQSRLLEAQGEVPPPPGGLDGLQPGSKQGLGPQQGQTQMPGTATLPRLSELGAIQPPQPPQPIQPQYETKMTPAQAALQGPSILHPPNNPR